MLKSQLRSKYVPDKDGKLKTFLELTEINVLPPPVSSRNPCFPVSLKSLALPSRAWRWVKEIIKAASL